MMNPKSALSPQSPLLGNIMHKYVFNLAAREVLAVSYANDIAVAVIAEQHVIWD